MGSLTYASSLIKQVQNLLLNLNSARPPFLIFHKESAISTSEFLSGGTVSSASKNLITKLQSGEWVPIPLNMDEVVVFDEDALEYNSSATYLKTSEEVFIDGKDEPDIKDVDTIETNDELKIAFSVGGELLGIMQILGAVVGHDFHKFKEDYRATFIGKNFIVFGGLTMKNINMRPYAQADKNGKLPENIYNVAITFDKGYSRRKGETTVRAGKNNEKGKISTITKTRITFNP